MDAARKRIQEIKAKAIDAEVQDISKEEEKWTRKC
jgi:hypothetical protein